MDDVLAMRLIQRGAHLGHYFQRRGRRERGALIDQTPEALALYQLHHQIDHPVRRNAEVVDRDGVRVLQPRCGLGLAPKSFDSLRVAQLIGMKDLDCDRVADQQACRSVHRGHSAHADL